MTKGVQTPQTHTLTCIPKEDHSPENWTTANRAYKGLSGVMEGYSSLYGFTPPNPLSRLSSYFVVVAFYVRPPPTPTMKKKMFFLQIGVPHADANKLLASFGSMQLLSLGF